MKRKIILGLLVLLAFGVCTDLQAQTGKKKKKKKTKTTQTITTDSTSSTTTGAAGSAGTTGAAAPQGPTPPDGAIDSSFGLTDGLVADTSVATYADFPMDSTKPSDGFYKIPMLRGAKPYAFPRESKYDIRFYKRIWRMIDVTDSVNKIFAVPGETLISIILDAIKNNKLIAYRDDKFTHRLTYTQALKALAPDSIIISQFDSTGQELGTKKIANDFNPDSVTRYEIKEDIFLDKTRGRVVTYIVGLAPIKTLKTTAGDFIGFGHPFWLYFPQCRGPFAQREIYDTQRDIYNVSYDDIFIQRNFKTVIVKESNPGDLKIVDKYPNDEEKQKKEADRIEQDLQKYKKNLWKY